MIEIECVNASIEFSYNQKNSLISFFKNKKVKNFSKNILALDQVSIIIKKGENIGILGKNGSGKSTFLRLLAGVYKPTSGYIKINNSPIGIFELNTGIDNDASGYENIFLLMAFRGIPSSFADKLIRDVEEFTELGDALKRPVRTYSKGMKLRLTFAISTFFTNRGILLIDEIMNVGDYQFKNKSQLRISNMIKKTGAFILASHSASLLKTHCSRGIIFEQGKIIFDGEIKEAISYYNENNK
jgi:ABC-type polysaccharide/polyol phosphate transport system ATPase subunit